MVSPAVFAELGNMEYHQCNSLDLTAVMVT